jgi:hypothetical protein
MFQKLIKIITCGAIILCTNLHAADAGRGGVEPLTFSDANWAAIPNPGELSAYDILDLFVGLEKNGRNWNLCAFNNDEFKDILEDHQFDVRTLMDPDLFARHPFSVDSEGYIQYEVFLVSRTKTMPFEDEDGAEFALSTRLSIVTKLTDEELANPIVKAAQSPLSFEQQRKLFREKPEDFKGTEGIRNARRLLIFSRPEKRIEIERVIEAELKATAPTE